ncbi:DUF6922 domain-containing protein [Parabacteroides bouchesdurhonensis]|uniref:DUF6922 domain-containing protein n=1 Tax=Parabacteroides bouchesdurhonensis TaxID=1936995 RepID=UPI000C826092|nr:hypothetical protein [Parabacteroides bouchesdurhonensis]
MKQPDLSKTNIINLFSPYLFWDVDRNNLDWEKHSVFIIERVLEYGQYSDWQLLRSRFSISEIAEQAKQIRQLDPKALSFIVLMSNTSKEDYKCYITKQSTPAHWNF